MAATALNYANLSAFLLNAIVTYGVNYLPGAQSNPELSAKYQTLITPAGYAFAIWGLIFTSELVCSLSQVFSLAEEARKRLQWNFVGANLAQIAWCLAFAYDHVAFSVVAMLVLWYYLLNIVLCDDDPSSIQDQRSTYWLLKFPIDLHAGWITAAFFVNVNLALVKLTAPPAVQLVSATFSLVCLVCAATYLVWKRHNWTMGVVLIWAVAGIATELRSPRGSIVQLFSAAEISAVQFGAILGGCLVTAVLIASWISVVRKNPVQAENVRLLE